MFLCTVITLLVGIPLSRTQDMAECYISPTSGTTSMALKGTVKFKQTDNNYVTVTAGITGFTGPPEDHGWGIYPQGDLGRSCANAGTTISTAIPNARHDTGGNFNVVRNKTGISLRGNNPSNIIGKTLVIHRSDGSNSERLGCCIVMRSPVTMAQCNIDAFSGSSAQTSGMVTISQGSGGGPTQFTLDLQFDKNDAFTQHGFHVHDTGALGNKCRDAKGHYNPLNKEHGAPSDANRHVGDLGNIEEDGEGRVRTTFSDAVVSLTGPYSVLRRAIVVHQKTDDLGKGGNAESKKTGNAGARFGCCIIMKTPLNVATCTVDAGSGAAEQPIRGTVNITQAADGGPTEFRLDLSGFSTVDPYRVHGFHVHTTGDTGNQCKAAGGHYNPNNKEHGAPTDTNRHVGDLGNVDEDALGMVKTMISDTVASLTGSQSIRDRAIVIHAKNDDLGRGGNAESKKTGNAGARLGCCVIKNKYSTDTASALRPPLLTLITIVVLMLRISH